MAPWTCAVFTHYHDVALPIPDHGRPVGDAHSSPLCGCTSQELVDKQPQLPDDIQWHFIGHLQSKKSNMLVGECALESISAPWVSSGVSITATWLLLVTGNVPNLAMVETVDSEKVTLIAAQMASARH